MSPRQNSILRLYLPLAILVALFSLVVVERRQIRARWWAWRLSYTDDADARGYYLACLAATGAPAAGAVNSLAGDERADVRAMAVFALQRLPGGEGIQTLARLLRDQDVSVREAAASALIFMERDEATTALFDTLSQPEEPPAAAAAAALGRSGDAPACEGLQRAAREHSSPLVRAQCLESLAGRLRDSISTRDATSRPAIDACDPLASLVAALADRASFAGPLALERQVAAASARVGASPPNLAGANRCIASFAASLLRELTGGPPDDRIPTDESGRAALLAECRRSMAARAAPPG